MLRTVGAVVRCRPPMQTMVLSRNSCSGTCVRCEEANHGTSDEPTPESGTDWFKSHLPRTLNFEQPKLREAVAKPIDPAEESELDYVSMCGLTTNELPPDILDKVKSLVQEFGYKGDLERFGKYMVAKYRSRSCSESPKILPSTLLPQKTMRVNRTPLDRLLKSKGFEDLRAAAPELFSDTADDYSQSAISEQEDDKHKLFQMFYSPGTAVTYLAHRFPATFASNFRVLTEVLRRVPGFTPKRIMDYGSGPGVSSLAAVKVWDLDKSESRIVCVEPSQNMQKIGQYMLSDLGIPVEWQSGLYGVDSVQKFDLIIASYVLMEIRDGPSRDLLIENLYAKLDAGGLLVVIDCGTPTGFRFIHRIREKFIMNDPECKSWHIVAPCPHEGACPMALTGKDWCHFDQRVKRLHHTVYNKGNRKNNTDYEKFSYIVLRKGVESPRKKYAAESHAPTSWEKSYFWPRVVMPAIKAGGHTLIDVCAPPSSFERLTVSRAKPHGFGYRFSRKIMWGDLWRYPKRLARKDARESYTPEQVKEHMDKLREDVENTKKAVKKFKAEKQIDEQFYGN